MRTSQLLPLLFALLFLPTLAAAGDDTVDDAHRQEVEAWRADRHARLSKPDGWFSLVGLFWLDEGENALGSDPQSDVVLPPSTPGNLGVLDLGTGGEVELRTADGVAVTIDGEETTRATLATDAAGEPTLVELGSVRFHLIDRDGRVGVRIKDSQSPALLAFEGIEHYPLSSRFRVDARFHAYDPPRGLKIPTVLGTPTEMPSPGAVEFALDGKTHRLDVLEGGDDEYFIVFGDKTNGDGTYGGGRFLYADAADENGRVVLDFNRAYNPPCAFTPYATCPLPPPQNRLDVAIPAGEKTYGDGVH